MRPDATVCWNRWVAISLLARLPTFLILTNFHSGRPSSSHYFIGVQGDTFFYLDPHQSRPTLPYRANPDNYTSDEVDTCHTRRLRRLHLREMDPSMLLAFLVRNEDEWRGWRRGVSEVGVLPPFGDLARRERKRQGGWVVVGNRRRLGRTEG